MPITAATPLAVAPRRVILELPQTSEASEILAGSSGRSDMPIELETARALSDAGLVVDRGWPAIYLRAEESPPAGFTSRPRVHWLVDSMVRLGDAVAEALPIDLPTPSTRGAGPNKILLRGELPPGADGRAALKAASGQGVRVFADPAVALAERRSDDPAYGTVGDVHAALGVDALRAAGMTGDGVRVVLVDNGLNVAALQQLGRNHPFDPTLSCTTTSSTQRPGAFQVGHGTMAAFQVGIAATDATLADQAVIVGRPSSPNQPLTEALLSDIAPGYELALARLASEPVEERAMVISNSWALTRPEQDFPLGTPECFSDNPEHPFNTLVRRVVDAGANVVFAAGNCGETDPLECTFEGQPIRGANALSDVLTIGAVDVDGVRLAYSSQGLGLIAAEKPDVCGYSHYEGSERGTADWGTSAACPGVAGVIAAVRTVVDPGRLPPRALADAIRASARREAGTGPTGTSYNPDTGYGIIHAESLVEILRARGLLA